MYRRNCVYFNERTCNYYLHRFDWKYHFTSAIVREVNGYKSSMILSHESKIRSRTSHTSVKLCCSSFLMISSITLFDSLLSYLSIIPRVSFKKGPILLKSYNDIITNLLNKVEIGYIVISKN